MTELDPISLRQAFGASLSGVVAVVFHRSGFKQIDGERARAR